MIAWGFSRHVGLGGQGGMVASGRWHTRGRRILYCAPDPATALLEVLVHSAVRTPEALAGFQFLKIEVPDELSTERLEDTFLPDDWPRRVEVTREVGDRWLREGTSAILLVRSVLVPETWNILVNPLHDDAARVASVAEIEFPLDARLIAAA
ncbi:MAG: RES family NAD+ phosphorylase [Gammaproteobacteria bacterium]|nr:RES family NAD+ phosphorylase [Gammaproteobacteria bacterium]